MKRKVLLFLTTLLTSINLVIAQSSIITGTVVSEEDGEPVVGASVLIKGTNIGTITDIDGKFTIGNIPHSAHTLIVSFVGLKTTEVAIKPGVIKIALQTDAELLDEVMVVAYGTAKKSSLTGAVSSVNAETIEKTLVAA